MARKRRRENGDFDIFQLSGGIMECVFGARISFSMPYHRQVVGPSSELAALWPKPPKTFVSLI